MAAWASIGRGAWRATRAFFLVVLASIVGAHFGTLAGYGLGALTGDWAWINHGRCAGWTFFVVTAIIGIPTGHVRFCGDSRRRDGAAPRDESKPRKEPAPPDAADAIETTTAVKVESRLKSLVVAPLIGAFMGLILGGMAGGFLVAVYFFLALSPLGPGGWWPVLALSFRAEGGGFSTSDEAWLVPWLVVVGAFVLAGGLLGMFTTVTVGERRYEVFGRKAGE